MLHIVNKIKEKPRILFICVGLLLLLLCIFLNFIYSIYNHRTTKTNQKYPSVNL